MIFTQILTFQYYMKKFWMPHNLILSWFMNTHFVWHIMHVVLTSPFIGTYKPGRDAVWSSLHVHVWIKGLVWMLWMVSDPPSSSVQKHCCYLLYKQLFLLLSNSIFIYQCLAMLWKKFIKYIEVNLYTHTHTLKSINIYIYLKCMFKLFLYLHMAYM